MICALLISRSLFPSSLKPRFLCLSFSIAASWSLFSSLARSLYRSLALCGSLSVSCPSHTPLLSLSETWLLADPLTATDAELSHLVSQKVAVACEQQAPLRAAASKSWSMWGTSCSYSVVHMCVFVCVCECVTVCVCVYICIFMCVCVCVCIHTHTHIYTEICMYIAWHLLHLSLSFSFARSLSFSLTSSPSLSLSLSFPFSLAPVIGLGTQCRCV